MKLTIGLIAALLALSAFAISQVKSNAKLGQQNETLVQQAKTWQNQLSESQKRLTDLDQLLQEREQAHAVIEEENDGIRAQLEVLRRGDQSVETYLAGVIPDSVVSLLSGSATPTD